jgi:hypothetical protein
MARLDERAKKRRRELAEEMRNRLLSSDEHDANSQEFPNRNVPHSRD